MARFRRCQDRGHGLGVPHLPNQDDVGGLAQNAANGAGEIRRVMSDFDLLDDRITVRMHELDRVLDGHDVAATLRVDQIEKRGQGRALPASGRAGDQDEPLPGLGQALE